MRRRWLTIPALALAALTVLGLASTKSMSGGQTCLTKHCPSNTHCCIGCTQSPICVKNGVPCPECAPQ